MYGRLGGMYFLHLTEANERRRRLVQFPLADHAVRQPTGGGLAMFLRLLGVLGIGFVAIGTLATMVG